MKPKVAFFDFASCEGCQLQVVNLEEKILDLIEVVDVVSFREAMKEHSDDYDIAFIEGSIQRPMDEERLKKIRKNAKILVALGACACIGGVNKLRNQWSVENVKEEVYSGSDIEGNRLFNVFPTKAVNEVVQVDYYIPGCPIDRSEFAKVVTQIAIGRKPKLPSYPVCVECKKNENVCVFELGKFCLGPVTRAGCNAICPSFKDGCEGCRGFLDDPKMDAYKDVLRKYGITIDEMMKKFNMFNYRKGVY
ncbi:MAG: NADH:ubiquinone oxidoreductase [Candidatus Thermoplasmatota archaeon]|nr:NADH:ubiquinone oxidoreductase [Candidatus Thermoplasmatota archaeon]